VAEIRPSDVVVGVVHVDPVVHRDDRGSFVETWRREWIPGCREMVQANRAERVAGSLVGLHYHQFQADYWTVTDGLVRVVLHDLRAGSPTDGSTLCLDLGGDGSDRHKGLYIPPGVAHGFAALTDATVAYLVDGTYDPADELGVAWDDPAVAADWGVIDPVLSGRDRANPIRADLPTDLVPVFDADSPSGGAGMGGAG
jgi:dTDP-4-dehydrorhamnose 3,5-epimerase